MIFFFQAEDGIRDDLVTGVQTCALPISTAPAVNDPRQARFRLFDSITSLLRNAAAARPLVVVLDDLQSADTPSLLLLEFLAGALDGCRLLVVGTHRVGLSPAHPLEKTLVSLRGEAATTIALPGLDED